MSGNRKIGPEDQNVIIKFGGGLHTRASPDEIDGREAADGKNFVLDIQNRNLRPRSPFDLIGTVPNAASIRGGGSLLKTDGTVTTLFQAGSKVYSWDGHTTFTEVGTVSASSKLRGQWRSHVWNLTDELLLTDLALADTVKKWNGTTLSSVTFTNEASSGFGSFFAKYLNVSNERAIFSNVKDLSATTPHLIIGSKRSDYTVITVNNRPASSLSVADPFFLVTPDLKPINGHVESFGTAMISTERGQIFHLAGSTSQDFAFDPFFPNSCATGAESMEVIGNDMVYGRQGRIESVRDTNTFGNSIAADMTAIISDRVSTYNGWTLVFNSRLRRLYAFPAGVSEVWVLDQSMRESGQLSPWMRWTTDHAMGFQPTFVQSMLDPNDGLEYVFMGDSSGHIYRMEGTGTGGDGGVNNLSVQFLSKLFSARLDSTAYDVEGYIKYARNDAVSVSLTFQYQGENIFDNTISVDLPASAGTSYYGGQFYYGGSSYYGQMSGRLARTKFVPPGQNNEFQVLATVIGTADFSINEIGLRFRASS